METLARGPEVFGEKARNRANATRIGGGLLAEGEKPDSNILQEMAEFQHLNRMADT